MTDDIELWKDPANLNSQDKIVSAGSAVVTTLHITIYHIIIAVDSGSIHLFPHDNGGSIGEEKVVRVSERGVWCVSSWVGEDGGKEMERGKEEWIVVGGTGDRENLAVWMWDVDGELVCKNKLLGHTSTVRIVKVLDATTLISGSRDSTIRIWNIENGTCQAVLEGHTATVRCLDVHGNIAVLGSYDNDARIWDWEKKVCLHVLKHQSKLYAIATDGIRVVTGGLHNVVSVWDVATGACQAVLGGFTSLIGLLQLLPSSLLAADAKGFISLWSNESYSEMVWKTPAHEYAVTSVHSDGSKIVSGGSDGKVNIWNERTGELLHELISSSNAVWQVKWIGNSLIALYSENQEVVMKVTEVKKS